MCFESCDLLGSVVVVYAEMEVVRPANDPVLPRNEATGSYGDIREFECFYDGLGFV